jgi:glycosyltransferase involved in cell wall biosynthesis
MEEYFKPLVSILIPMYNSEKYISETLESCLIQVYKNIEIIIVDDQSTDTSYKICQKYAEQYDCIKLYKQKNSGAPSARNLAFKKSKGDYIQYLDADDLLSFDKIENQINLLKGKCEMTIAYSNFNMFTKKPLVPILNKSPILESFNNSIDFYNHLIITGWLQTSCWLISRGIINLVGEWREDLSRNQDGDFFGRVLLNSKKGIYSKQGGVYYRIDNPNSITSQNKGVRFYESYLKSFYNSADLIISYGTNSQKQPIAKAMNGFCERLILLESNEANFGFKKIERLGFSDRTIFQSFFLKKIISIFGYKYALKIKFFVFKIVNQNKLGV